MLSLHRGTTSSTERPQRSRGALAASLVVNAALIAAFVQALTHGQRWSELFRAGQSEPVRAERIGFVQLPKPAGPPTIGRSGGDGRPVTRTPAPVPPPVAPSVVPDDVPVAPPTATPAPVEGGSGPVVGAGGAAQGIQPTYTDSRLWARPGAPSTAPKTAKERIDSVLADAFVPARDSMLAEQEALAGQRKPGDWTVKGPGGKWGMDQSAIRLGKISIPNAILALLSADLQKNLRGNPIQMENDRRLAAIRADLLQHAQTEMNEDAFRSAVKQIRARKERERAARVMAQGTGGDVPPAQPDKKQ